MGPERATNRCASTVRRDGRQLDGVLLTHKHGDHVADWVLCRKIRCADLCERANRRSSALRGALDRHRNCESSHRRRIQDLRRLVQLFGRTTRRSVGFAFYSGASGPGYTLGTRKRMYGFDVHTADRTTTTKNFAERHASARRKQRSSRGTAISLITRPPPDENASQKSIGVA